MSPQIYTSFGCFYPLTADGTIAGTQDVGAWLEKAGLDGLEVNGYLPELAARLGFRFSYEDLVDIPKSFHSNHVDFNLASINSHVREAGTKQLELETIAAEKMGLPPVTIHPGKSTKRLDRGVSLSMFWESLENFFESAAPTVPMCLENMDDKPEKRCCCNLESEIAIP